VKEAAYKALYPDIKPTWKELTYLGLSSNGKKPTLSYSSSSQDSSRKFGSIHVSVSHDGDYTMAYVVVERRLHSSLRFFPSDFYKGNTQAIRTLDDRSTG